LRTRAAPFEVFAAFPGKGASVRPSNWETLITTTFVDVVDTLVDKFDVVDLLTMVADRSVAVLDFSAAGVMLVAPEGRLKLVAFSSESVRLVELFELQAQEGPCLDAYQSGQPIMNQGLAETLDRWPHFAPFALNVGFHTAHALPMRLRRRVIGALNLFQTHPGTLGQADIMAAQALADLATISILHNRATEEAKVVNEQLKTALESRVVIEQAKGVLVERTGLSMEVTFQRLRAYARSHNRLLAEVARDVVDGTLRLTTAELLRSPLAP
jgi:GAF domain-containing protein